ncbi:hypothetical protein C9374_002236 [Naegleria lovaniensis]|uniref:Uncharacterized protein n=1 Tax=Naegleria lovaniensis TaxID=51637 RepID=A0AA88GT07_NAELO|nr:uncharacterized protein C9374_002236 [Naegleria lovaniensis]KAG2386492.1 hypothetical protein C9374_002236 [Naegleria lovaniensis]
MPKEPLSARRLCVSGGASGADFEWVSVAVKVCQVEIISFAGHCCSSVNGAVVKCLSPIQLREADPKLEEANIYLKRNNYKLDLLRRN